MCVGKPDFATRDLYCAIVVGVIDPPEDARLGRNERCAVELNARPHFDFGRLARQVQDDVARQHYGRR